MTGAELYKELERNASCRVTACEVEASSHKCGALSKKKVIGRRSEQEGEWLDDLVAWVVKARPGAEDQLITRYQSKKPGGRCSGASSRQKW